MPNLTNEQKAKIYNDLLFSYQRVQEEIRLIRAKNFEVSESDQKKINFLEKQLREIYDRSQKLF